jgi:signal transduction histidine kinase
LLLLAQFDAGQSGVERYRLLDFSALMEGLCEDAEILALARDVRLQVLLGPSPRVKGDDLLLRRLVLNLIDNATKYNVPSGEVLCELTVAGAELQLRVSNTGPSILPANREQLFRRFFRADSARGRCGHGLGLALSLEIARSHGGNLVLAPDPAPGRTQFLLTLPTAVEQA